jgi:hypothetical protein
MRREIYTFGNETVKQDKFDLKEGGSGGEIPGEKLQKVTYMGFKSMKNAELTGFEDGLAALAETGVWRVNRVEMGTLQGSQLFEDQTKLEL